MIDPKGGIFMWKKLATIILVLALLSLFTITPAQAGDKQRHMWQGAGIALGAFALFGLLVHQHMAPPPPPHVLYPPPPPPPPHPEYFPGHWEMTREWVPGTWERVWIPGHYDRWGHWMTGHYEERQIPGRYVERRAWVEGYYRYD